MTAHISKCFQLQLTFKTYNLFFFDKIWIVVKNFKAKFYFLYTHAHKYCYDWGTTEPNLIKPKLTGVSLGNQITYLNRK